MTSPSVISNLAHLDKRRTRPKRKSNNEIRRERILDATTNCLGRTSHESNFSRKINSDPHSRRCALLNCSALVHSNKINVQIYTRATYRLTSSMNRTYKLFTVDGGYTSTPTPCWHKIPFLVPTFWWLSWPYRRTLRPYFPIFCSFFFIFISLTSFDPRVNYSTR